jgi:hypothetical protein
MVQYKEHERLGKAQTPICRTSPIVIELAYYFRFTDRKWKYAPYEKTVN